MKPPSDLSPAEVVAWMREQARLFTRMADEMERAFGLRPEPTSGRVRVRLNESVFDRGPGNMSPSEERVRGLLEGPRKWRRKSLAEEAGVPEHEIDRIVAECDDIIVGDRGWITIAGTDVDQGEQQ